MLRFDVPQVWSNVIRWEAFVSFLVCLIALTAWPWALGLLVLQGFVRGVLGHHRCPLHLVWKRMFEAMGKAGHKENAGAKMFANKILLVASGAALALYVAGSPLWKVPCIVLMVFTTLEWAVSFCAACWVYGFWYQKFPPRGS